MNFLDMRAVGKEGENVLLSLLGLDTASPLHERSAPPMAFSLWAKAVWKDALLSPARQSYLNLPARSGYLKLLSALQEEARNTQNSVMAASVSDRAAEKAVHRRIMLGRSRIASSLPQELYAAILSIAYVEVIPEVDADKGMYRVRVRGRIVRAPSLHGLLMQSRLFSQQGRIWTVANLGDSIRVVNEGLRTYLEFIVSARGQFLHELSGSNLADYVSEIGDHFAAIYAKAARQFPFHRRFPRSAVPDQDRFLLSGM